jgi:hypothetical protein
MPGTIHNCRWILEYPLTWDNLYEIWGKYVLQTAL